jgi:hypothetical protein
MAKEVYQTLKEVSTNGLPPIWIPHVVPQEALLRAQDIFDSILTKERGNIINLADTTLKVKIAEQQKKLNMTGGTILFTEEDCSF